MLEDNLVGLIEKNAREMPNVVAMREKRYAMYCKKTGIISLSTKLLTWREKDVIRKPVVGT